eukprot:3518433-Pleurochrysis_carterae.AAC.1
MHGRNCQEAKWARALVVRRLLSDLERASFCRDGAQANRAAWLNAWARVRVEGGISNMSWRSRIRSY